VTTPPQDPFGRPREGDAQQSGYGPQPSDGQSYGQPRYGEQPYGQSYGQPVQGYGSPQVWHGPAQTETKAIVALVCAIAAWVVLPLLPAIAALMIGKTARREILQSGGRLTGDGLVTAAKVIAWVNIALCVLVVVFVVLAFTLFAASWTGVS
jgi:hypothetical protein